MRALARSVGATTGIVTHHFLDRAEVVEAALGHARSTMLDRALALPAGSTAFDLLVATLPLDDRMVTSWRVWLDVRAAALHDPDMARFHREMYDEWQAESERRLQPELGEAAAVAVDHLMAVVDGIALRAALDPDAWPESRQRKHLTTAWDAVVPRSGEHE